MAEYDDDRAHDEVVLLTDALSQMFAENRDGSDSSPHPPVSPSYFFTELEENAMRDEPDSMTPEEALEVRVRGNLLAFQLGMRMGQAGVTYESFLPCDCLDIRDEDIASELLEGFG